MSDQILVHVFDLTKIENQNPVADLKINLKVMHLAWNPNDFTQFVTVGKDHMYFCSVNGDKITKKLGQMKEKVSFGSVAFSQLSKGTFFTGGSNGSIYTWKGNATSGQKKLGKSAILCLCLVKVDEKTENLFAGGNDSKVTIFKVDPKDLTQLNLV